MIDQPPADKPVRDVAAAVIRRADGRLLLVQRGATAPTFPLHWGPVTGLVEDGETPAEAARRELREEVGGEGQLEAVGEPFLVDVGSFVARVFPFLCTLTDPEAVHLDWENQAFAWLTVSEALARPTLPAFDEDLRRLGLID